MTVELNHESIARVAGLPAVVEAAKAAQELIALWPLTEAMQMDNDAKYAENLQVRITRAFARILTGQDVTVPDAEYVYEGADEIPGRPQTIVDALLAANDAYDAMADYSDTGDTQLVFDAAEALGVDWGDATVAAVRETIDAAEAQVVEGGEAPEDDAAGEAGEAGDADDTASVDAADATEAEGDKADETAAIAQRFASALAVCDALLGEVANVADAADDESVRAAAARALPVLLYVNELREQCSIPRICLSDEQVLDLIRERAAAAARSDAADATLDVTAVTIAPLAAVEWRKHREDVLWNPDEAKKKAKEEDEKRNKEALAAKFAHVKDDPSKPHVEL
ncbi:hypothetical protein [Bifidobacterium oedipodis]|uniref:Uncharacterized protein n=1 Tax=Bifidobacterium oedipodis TaxID=2675322 RepID=A0A7Y0ERB8_9BIFI|nr:hypothetical protein [Bifidobacterium sp. DSM 109957]NMM94975.1 hypothetical protein [Bifidobacterium sp. DSM 109957]